MFLLKVKTLPKSAVQDNLVLKKDQINDILVTSNSPRSVKRASGMTGRARKESRTSGSAESVHPRECAALRSARCPESTSSLGASVMRPAIGRGRHAATVPSFRTASPRGSCRYKKKASRSESAHYSASLYGQRPSHEHCEAVAWTSLQKKHSSQTSISPLLGSQI